ncbi:MAG: gluconate 2-dehydrogenase subunit 3 family protein [Pseudomonadota bacterium]|nr:gluconate 2-dehydrogenase subunit 3 family protein [Pseudomonadota bacterium]
MDCIDRHRDETSRRSFLLSTGGLLTTAWLGTQWAAISAAAHHADAMAAAGTAPALGFQFLSPAEAKDVEAIAAQIVPSGASAGAREAHAVYFIDRALATFFAAEAADFRRGLGEFQAKFRGLYPQADAFAEASAETQIAFLTTVDRTPFFGGTRMLTVLGMFSSPRYGGNYRGSGWTMMGFEDRHAFVPPFGYYDAEYTGFVPYASKPA